jgi:choline monooxygenase
MPRFFVDPNIARAHTLHTDFYNSSAILEECKEKLFAESWQFIGSEKLVANTGDVYPFTLLEGYVNEPLVLTRDEKEQVHLLSNVCTHRGNLVAETACNISNLRCRYHGRRFHLDGKFLSMPEFREVENFPAESDNLHSLELHSWSQWLFTSLRKKHNANTFFKEMAERVAWMPLDQFQLRPERCREFHVKAHWALYCENYLEGFHIPFVHNDLNAVIDYGDYATELYYPFSSLQIGIGKNTEDCFQLPENSPDFGKNVAAYYFWIFPNMMFNFYPWGLSVNVVKPLSVAESRVSYFSYVWDESKLTSGAGAALDKVELEDEEIVQQVQKGIQSRFYTQGRYSPTREMGTHHFHRILAEFLQ